MVDEEESDPMAMVEVTGGGDTRGKGGYYGRRCRRWRGGRHLHHATGGGAFQADTLVGAPRYGVSTAGGARGLCSRSKDPCVPGCRRQEHGTV